MDADDSGDDTIVRPRVRPAMPTPVGADSTLVSAIDEDTIVPGPRQGGRRSAPAPVAAPIAAASWHRILVGGGTQIALDVPALLGRNPVRPRVPTDHPPRLVVVPSPLGEVSATHLEIRQHGTSVIVTDLRSTNGTVVIVPGAAPVKLRQGESLVVSAGTLVDIGDGNTIEILPIQRALPGSGVPSGAVERPQ